MNRLLTPMILLVSCAVLGLGGGELHGQTRSKDDISVAQVEQTAKRYLRTRDYGKAESAYREVVSLAPNEASGYEGLGKALEGQKRWRDAAAVYKQGLETIKPTWYKGFYRLAFVQRKAGEPAAAVGNYEKYIEKVPSDPDAYYGLAVACEESSEAAKALAAFRKYVELETRPSEQEWVERAKEAIAKLETQVAEETPEPEAPPVEAEAAAVAEPPPAEEPVTEGTLAELLAKGDQAMGAKDYALAANHFAAAATKSEEGIEAHYKLGVVRAIRGDLPGAIGAWQTVLSRDPSMAKAKQNIARAKKRLEMSAEGRIDDPGLGGDAAAKLALAERYLDESRPYMALRVLDPLVVANPTSGRARGLRGRAFMAVGRYPDASRELELALSYSPDDEEILGNLGLTYVELADTDRARYFLRRYLDRVDPDKGDPAKEPYRVALKRLAPAP